MNTKLNLIFRFLVKKPWKKAIGFLLIYLVYGIGISFKLSFTTEESELPSLVCQAPSNIENFRSRHEEVADIWLYTIYLKKRFITKLLNMFRLKLTGKLGRKFPKSSNWPIK